ncbi:MAG: UvrD-helicase domain-containing protein [Candidatus Latescibacteria bacterium]|nr:UvrD-helicase domain-containing protein [Candidatus Latescibacterota bacterium]
MFDLSGLNPEQREAVEHTEGPTLVLAGAGSGKTRVLTHKIAYIVSRGTKPWRILAVTFTNKAAREMAGRVEKLIGISTRNLWIGTFHGICVRILRREADRWGFRRDFTIYDRDDQISIVKKILKESGLESNSQYAPSKILGLIGKAKNNGVPPERMKEIVTGPAVSSYEHLFRRYNEMMYNSGAFDFDDLLLKPVEMFNKDSESLKTWQDRFTYTLVDEYQDTNHTQYLLMKLLGGATGNVTVVGDDDQSIYSWRGADIRNILEFEKDNENVKTVRLERNYRSTRNILDAANAVVVNNKSRMSKRLWTDGPDGDKVVLFECRDEHDEADRIVRNIESERTEKGFKLRDFVILYRTNAQSRLFEDILRRRAIPYIIVGGTKFYERKEIKDLLAYFRLVVNAYDSVSFERAITTPKRGIGTKTIETIVRFAADNGISPVDACDRIEEYGSGKMIQKIQSFHGILSTAIELRKQKASLYDIARTITESAGYELYLRNEYPENAEDRIDNVNELITAMRDFVNESEEDDLAAFLAEVSLVSDVDTWDADSDALTLMTLHSAKGLEFPSVYIAGVEEGLFPLSRSLEEEETFEEERRLFYVGITRAEKILHLSYASYRQRYGSFSGGPSPFIDELPKDVIEFSASGKYEYSYTDTVSQHGNVPKQDVKTPEVTAFEDYSQELPEYDGFGMFKIGSFVLHPKFGRGQITAVSGSGDSLKLTILFGTQKKNILPKYASLVPA